MIHQNHQVARLKKQHRNGKYPEYVAGFSGCDIEQEFPRLYGIRDKDRNLANALKND